MTASRILLLGCTGQIGWELQRALAPLGDLIALSRSDSEPTDFSQPRVLAAMLDDLRPQIIVNAVAYTAVDRAESEPERARLLNATSVGVLAQHAAQTGAWLLHYSTDYVFDGSGDQSREEGASTGPLNVYGQTKLEGEELIRASGCQHLILRTSWVYAARGGNFARTMLKLAAECEHLTVVDDQIGAPTGADLLADLSAHVLREVTRPNQGGALLSGTYHAVAGGQTSWCGYARHVIDFAAAHGQALKVQTLEPVPSSAFPTPARRPHNSRLSTRKLQDTFGFVLPPWQSGVERMLREVLSV